MTALGPLQFSFDEMVEEVKSIKDIASSFLDPSAPDILSAFEKALTGIRSSGHGHISRWAISEKQPIKTIISHGGYEPDDNGEHNVIGEMTCVWEISPTDPVRTKKQSKIFSIEGNASVRIRLREHGGTNDGRELAMWRMELGATDSPGCFFHAQVLGELDSPPFPHSLSVPRLPIIAVTPMAALEFLLGELFQDRWPKEAVKEGGARDTWKGIQRRRLCSIFEWQRQLVENCSGSPWRALKQAKPNSNLFTK